MSAVDHFHDPFRRPQSRDHNALARRRPGTPIPVPVLQPRRRQNRRQYCQDSFASFVHKRILTYSPFLRLHKFMICDSCVVQNYRFHGGRIIVCFWGWPEYSCLGERASA
jgi:hypothetical protein